MEGDSQAGIVLAMVIILIALLTFVASTVGTITGFGISTIMVPVVALFYPLPQTLLFVGIIHLFGNVWKLLFFRKGVRLGLILKFGIPGIIATYIGARLIFAISNIVLSRILGAFLIGYVLFLVLKPAFKVRQSDFNAVLGGSLSGFLAGIFGIGGAVRGAFLTIFDLPKEMYIATAGAIALFVDSTRVVTYVAGGSRINQNLLLGLLFFIPVSLLGAAFAKRIVGKIPQKQFRIVIAIFILLIGLKLIIIP